MQEKNHNVSRLYNNREFGIAIGWTALSLVLSGLILSVGYLLFSSSMAGLRSEQAAQVAPQKVSGAALAIRSGSGYRTPGRALAVTELRPGVDDGRAIATVLRRFNAADFPVMEYKLAGRHLETYVYFIWRTAEDPETVFNTLLPLNAGKGGTLVLSEQESWTGKITEIGFDIYGKLPEPLLIKSLTFLPLPQTWQAALADVWREWLVGGSWSQRSVHTLMATHRPSGLSPVIAISAWSGLAFLLLALARLMARPPRPLSFLFAVVLPWLALDLLWQSSLSHRLDETRYLFAGKTQTEKHLANYDSDLYRYAAHLKADVLPAPGTRIFLLEDTAHRTYRRLRAQYYLLPHNLYNYDRFPRPEQTEPGDYILVLGEVPGLAYKQGALRWDKKSLPAELIDVHSMGSVYRIVGGGQ